MFVEHKFAFKYMEKQTFDFCAILNVHLRPGWKGIGMLKSWIIL